MVFKLTPYKIHRWVISSIIYFLIFLIYLPPEKLWLLLKEHYRFQKQLITVANHHVLGLKISLLINDILETGAIIWRCKCEMELKGGQWNPNLASFRSQLFSSKICLPTVISFSTEIFVIDYKISRIAFFTYDF